MLCLYLQAPFAACRTFTAGWYRPTAKFLAPSTVYGLVLNVAGIDSRLREEDPGHDSGVSATLVRGDLPQVRLALGIPPSDDGRLEPPRVQTVLQQLHNYPVGKDAGMPSELSRGSKNNISPVRREFLSDVRALVCVDGHAELERRVRDALQGRLDGPRYGLPFLGDNQFLVDRLVERPWPQLAFWYRRLGAAADPAPLAVRLTAWIDRADMSKTRSALYAPTEEPSSQPPEDAWTTIPP